MSKTPEAQGLYDPRNEHDACGVGFVADVKGRKSHEIVQEGLEILLKLDHRGAVGADPLAGDGAGLLSQIPDQFFRKQQLGFTLLLSVHTQSAKSFFLRTKRILWRWKNLLNLIVAMRD